MYNYFDWPLFIHDRTKGMFMDIGNMNNVISWIRENAKGSDQPIQLSLYSSHTKLKGL